MGTSSFRSGEVWSLIEKERKRAQNEYEKSVDISYRKAQGQFFTDLNVAEEIINYAYSIIEKKSISFLEPAFGFGSFYSALSKNNYAFIKKAIGVEKDSELCKKAKVLWDKDEKVTICNTDFFEFELQEKVDLLITNPPYIRHQGIESDVKAKYSELIKSETGIKLSGLSGSYCYYLLHAQKWLKRKALAGWLLPSEFMDVNYGEKIKAFLLNEVTLVRIHRYDPEDGLFADAHVTSAVVWYKNEKNKGDYEVEFSYGGTHSEPLISKKIKKSILEKEKKWTRFPQKEARSNSNTIDVLGNYFDIKRGLATGDNNFFIVDEDIIKEYGLQMEYLQPILPSPRYLKTDKVKADSTGKPVNVESLFLINCHLEEEEIMKSYPELWHYLENGQEETAKKYLCKMRKKWYFQEQREAAPILCTYMGRGERAIRFINNKSNAVATNSYLMLYPKKKLIDRLCDAPNLLDEIWEYLNAMDVDHINAEGRIYGGGLKKIEPKELKNVKVSFANS